jgi:uncharacterized membrane protein
MGTDIVRTETADAPVDIAFDYLDDYREVPKWMFGVEDFQVVSEKDRGLGSEFEATLNLGIKLHTRIRCTEWEKNRVIGMDSVKGFKVRSRWYFDEEGPGRTKVTANVTYELPFGPAGRAMGKIVGPAVQRAVGHSAETLIKNIEALAAKGSAG